jgi:RHS repeat-associated protein
MAAPVAGLGSTFYVGGMEIESFGGGTAEALSLYPHPSLRLRQTNSAAATYGWTVLHRDAQGTVRGTTSSSGVLQERASFAPYGKQTAAFANVTSGKQSKGWIGERCDGEAGLQYLNARYFDPDLAMFLQPDWWEVTEPGVGTNRYAYAGGDPVNGVDPGGHSWLDETFDSIFGEDSFNKTFGDSACAWSDRTFGNPGEQIAGHSAATYLRAGGSIGDDFGGYKKYKDSAIASSSGYAVDATWDTLSWIGVGGMAKGIASNAVARSGAAVVDEAAAGAYSLQGGGYTVYASYVRNTQGVVVMEYVGMTMNYVARASDMP